MIKSDRYTIISDIITSSYFLVCWGLYSITAYYENPQLCLCFHKNRFWLSLFDEQIIILNHGQNVNDGVIFQKQKGLAF